MNEPTRGPWRWKKADGGNVPVYGYILRGADDWPVLGIAPVDERSDRGGPAETTDGRLIEKAPEMLALLRRLEQDREAALDIEFVVQVDALVAYVLGEPTREEEDERIEMSCSGYGPERRKEGDGDGD